MFVSNSVGQVQVAFIYICVEWRVLVACMDLTDLKME